jgi:hypothetical protein
MGRVKSGTIQMVATGVLLAGMAVFAMIYYAPPPAPPSLIDPIGRCDAAGVKDAIARHADGNRMDVCGLYPLSLAVSQGSAPIVELLIDAGADVKQVDRNGLDALGQAVMCNRTEIVKMLLDHGAPIRNAARQRNLISMAAVMSPDSVKMLLDAGANPNEQWPGEVSPLQRAIDADSPEAARALLAAGATPIESTHHEAIATTEHSKERTAHRVTRVARWDALGPELRVMAGGRRPLPPPRMFIATNAKARMFPLRLRAS